MSAVLVTGLTVTQNAVSSLAMAVIIASTHFAYPRRDGQAELAWITVIFSTRNLYTSQVVFCARRLVRARVVTIALA